MKHNYTYLFLFATLLQQATAQTNSVNLIAPGGSSVAYASIGAAYAAIPLPVSGNYLIEITASYTGTSETYPIQLTDKGLTAVSPTITLRPAAGNNGAVIQRTTAAAGAVIQFNGADNIVLDGRPGGMASGASAYLTVNDPYSGDNASRNIEFLGGANNNVVRYVNSFAAESVSTGTGARNILIGAGSTATGGNNSNTITNCVVRGGQRGIQDSGLSAAVPNSNNIISNDTVRTFGFLGIVGLAYQTNITIQNNYVAAESYNVPLIGTTVTLIGIRQQSLISSGTSNILNNTISLISTSPYVSNMDAIFDAGSGTENIVGNNIIAVSTPGNTSNTSNFVVGISLSTVTGSTAATMNVSRNKISGLSSTNPASVRGIEVFPAAGSAFNLSNNFIAIPGTNANATSVFGILLGSVAGAYTTNLYYNSIRVGGQQTASNTASGYGIYKGSSNTGSVLNQLNNISIMERTGGSTTAGLFAAFFLNSTVGSNTANYNTYYATDAVRGFAAGGWDGFIYKNDNVTGYRAGAAPQEQNTNFGPVTFVSATDLHLAPPSTTDATLVGIPVAGITLDIDGGTRSATAPYRGADEPNVAAPVQLLSFSGEGRGSYNVLRWQTATEQNSKGFYLERSADGRAFTSLGFVPTQAINGHSSVALNYTFEDVKPLGSKGFYRLRQTDLDGKETYSGIVTLAGKAPLALSIASVYPNPVVNTLNLIVKTPVVAKATLTIIDGLGKMVMRQTAPLVAGDNYLWVNTEKLHAGVYTIGLTDLTMNEILTARFVK